MNFRKILSDIEQAKSEDFIKVSDRRNALKNLGTAVVSVALPATVSSYFNSGQASKTEVIAALNTALELEYFEYAFYHTANNTRGLIPERLKATFNGIEANEHAHVEHYINTIVQLGGTPFRPNGMASMSDNHYVPSAYDFTKGGTNPVFSNFMSFMVTSKAIETRMTQAYSGLLEIVAGSSVYAKMQQVATTEARHAAHLQMLDMPHIYTTSVPAEYLSATYAPRNIELKDNGPIRRRFRGLGLV